MTTKEKILSYIMDSPENTNPAIISSMLDEYNSVAPKKGVPLSITASSSILQLLMQQISFQTYPSLGTLCVDNDGNYTLELNLGDYNIGIPAHHSGYYWLGVVIITNDDMYNVTLNGRTTYYDETESGYYALIQSETYPERYDLVVTAKR